MGLKKMDGFHSSQIQELLVALPDKQYYPNKRCAEDRKKVYEEKKKQQAASGGAGVKDEAAEMEMGGFCSNVTTNDPSSPWSQKNNIQLVNDSSQSNIEETEYWQKLYTNQLQNQLFLATYWFRVPFNILDFFYGWFMYILY